MLLKRARVLGLHAKIEFANLPIYMRNILESTFSFQNETKVPHLW